MLENRRFGASSMQKTVYPSSEIHRFIVSKNPFRHDGRLLKKLRKPSNSRLSAYIGTVGRELRRKSKFLRSKQDYSKIVPYMSF